LERTLEIALTVPLDRLIRLMNESVEGGKSPFGRRTNFHDSAAYVGGRNKEAPLVDRLLCHQGNRDAETAEKQADPPPTVSRFLMQSNSHHGSGST
jgi:hypothetical protein